MSSRVVATPLLRASAGATYTDQDLVAVEAPLSLTVRDARGDAWPLGTLMRTPGDDDDLVAGCLYVEGLVRAAGDIAGIVVTTRSDDAAAVPTAIVATLAPHVVVDRDERGRATMATSACGLCGRLALRTTDRWPRIRQAGSPEIDVSVISDLPGRLRDGQAVFAETGGLHAAAVFDLTGSRIDLAEDIGRHNAVDKIVGRALTRGALPLHAHVIVVSGRVAYEIVEKVVLAGAAILVAVGAPSSLAVDAARASGLTLIGFARDGRFNIYTGTERVRR